MQNAARKVIAMAFVDAVQRVHVHQVVVPARHATQHRAASLGRRQKLLHRFPRRPPPRVRPCIRIQEVREPCMRHAFPAHKQGLPEPLLPVHDLEVLPVSLAPDIGSPPAAGASLKQHPKRSHEERQQGFQRQVDLVPDNVHRSWNDRQEPPGRPRIPMGSYAANGEHFLS